jgi:hypothetical protein
MLQFFTKKGEYGTKDKIFLKKGRKSRQRVRANVVGVAVCGRG